MISRGATSVAAVSYAANVGLGLGVATGRIRTGRARWVHHALYVCTASAIAVATTALFAEHGRRGFALAPALVPLAAIPYGGTHGRRHPALALSIGPFVTAGLVVAWRTPPSVRSLRNPRTPRQKGRR